MFRVSIPTKYRNQPINNFLILLYTILVQWSSQYMHKSFGTWGSMSEAMLVSTEVKVTWAWFVLCSITAPVSIRKMKEQSAHVWLKGKYSTVDVKTYQLIWHRVLNYSSWYMYCFLYWMRPISSSYKPHVSFLFRSFLCSLVIDAFPSYYLPLQFQFLGAYNPRVCDTFGIAVCNIA